MTTATFNRQNMRALCRFCTILVMFCLLNVTVVVSVSSLPGGVEARPPQLFFPVFAVGVLCFSGWVQPPQPPANFFPGCCHRLTLLKSLRHCSPLHSPLQTGSDGHILTTYITGSLISSVNTHITPCIRTKCQLWWKLQPALYKDPQLVQPYM